MSKRWSEEADTCNEFVQSAYEEYSVDTVAELLLPTGLLIDKSTQYVGALKNMFSWLETMMKFIPNGRLILSLE